MKEQARRQFEHWAASYDRSLLNRFLFRPAAEAFIEEIARWRAARCERFRLLDIGCGTGTLAGLLLRCGWPVDVVGLDYSPRMCRQAAAKTAGLSEQGSALRVPGSGTGGDSALPVPRSAFPAFVTGDSERLPFAAAGFDVITCSNSFHHYPHQQQAVCEMKRLLAPGGRLLIIDGFRDNVIGWMAFDFIIARVEQHVHHASWRHMRDYFREAGFADVRQRKFNFWMPLLLTSGDA